MLYSNMQNSFSEVLHNFQQVVFHSQNIVFHNIRKFITIQKFNSNHRGEQEVYKLHALIKRNKERTLQWSYNVIASKLKCDSFELPKKVLLTFSGEMNSYVNSL